MPKAPEYRVKTTIETVRGPHQILEYVRTIHAYSVTDAARRVTAAFKLIDQAKEDAPDGNPNQD